MKRSNFIHVQIYYLFSSSRNVRTFCKEVTRSPQNNGLSRRPFSRSQWLIAVGFLEFLGWWGTTSRFSFLPLSLPLWASFFSIQTVMEAAPLTSSRHKGCWHQGNWCELSACSGHNPWPAGCSPICDACSPSKSHPNRYRLPWRKFKLPMNPNLPSWCTSSCCW